MNPDPAHEWLQTSLTMITTMRSDDANRWSAASLVELAQSFSLHALGFSVGGITAFYPTEVQGHDRSPSLGGRDLVRETIDALHAAGLRAIGRIDPSLGSAEALARHPDRFARTRDGEPIRLHDHYLTCPNGDHYGRFMLDVVREIVTRYELDGLWANAAQFSPWSAPRCHCGNCRRLFEEAHPALAFPVEERWSDPAWKRYNEWRYTRIADWDRRVHEVVRSVRPTCAWLPLSQVIESWDHIRKGGWDVDLTSRHSDGVVLEAQRRYCNLWWPGMEARYAASMEGVAGAGITISYFYPWWRFTHAPAAENRVWAAQMVANGARPWVHITGWFGEHFDRRGLASMRSMFALLRRRGDVYERTRSASDVAIVYSRRTLDYVGADAPDARYLDGFRGAYNALMDGRIAFDLLSDRQLAAADLSRWRTLLLPHLECIDDATAQALRSYLEAGGRIVATGRTGFCDAWGEARERPLVAYWLGAGHTGRERRDMKAAYAHIHEAGHAVLRGIEDTDVLPLAGHVQEFVAGDASDAGVLELIPPVEAFAGSGMSVPEFNAASASTGVPLLLSRRVGRGEMVYFPWEPDRVGFTFGLRDPMRLLCNAVRPAGEPPLVEVHGKGLIDVSVRDRDGARLLHLVNFNGPTGMRSANRRAVEEIVPLHGLRVRLRLPEGASATRVERVVAGGDLPFEIADGVAVFELPVLEEFESIRVELVTRGH